MRRRWPKHESKSTYKEHRRSGTHERKKPLYRGKGTKAREEREFEDRYGKKKGKQVYGAVVGKVYREKYGHPYRGANSQKVEKVTRFQDNAELMKWNMNTNVDIADIDMDIETMHTADITAHVVTASVIAE